LEFFSEFFVRTFLEERGKFFSLKVLERYEIIFTTLKVSELHFSRKNSKCPFSEIFTGHVISRQTCFSWSVEIMNLGIIQCLNRVLYHSKVVSREEYLWRKNSTGPKSRFCDIFVRLSGVFHSLIIVSGEGNEGKILKKDRGTLLTRTYRSSHYMLQSVH